MSKNSSCGSTAAGAAGSRGFGAAALREGATTPSCAAQPLWSSSAAQASILAQRGCRLGDGCPTAAPAHDARGLLLWLAPCGALGAPIPRAHAVERLQSGCGGPTGPLAILPPYIRHVRKNITHISMSACGWAADAPCMLSCLHALRATVLHGKYIQKFCGPTAGHKHVCGPTAKVKILRPNRLYI